MGIRSEERSLPNDVAYERMLTAETNACAAERDHVAWHGVPSGCGTCYECGAVVPDDDGGPSKCDLCGTKGCGACLMRCPDCGEYHCVDCYDETFTCLRCQVAAREETNGAAMP